MTAGTPLNIPKTQTSFPAEAAFTVATLANVDHDYTVSDSHARNQDAHLIPLPSSNPDTPIKPKGKTKS